MIYLYFLAVTSGLAGLWRGGDWVVTYAIAVAQRFNVSTFFLGFIILALAADIPELAISISSALQGVSEVALGDIIGGNFSDVTMVVGSALLIAGNRVRISARDNKALLTILAITSTIMLVLLGLGSISFYHGLGLIAIYALTTLYFWRHKDMRDLLHDEVAEIPAAIAAQPTWELTARLLASLVWVMGVSHLTVQAALALAAAMHLSPETVGATILGIGTTLPELALCFGALRRGDFGLVVGPTMGTVLGQTTLILGVLATLSSKPLCITGLNWACGFMFMAFAILAAGLLQRRPMGRGTGAALVSLFIAYLAYQVVW